MAEPFDESALMIAIDLVEQGGMPDEAEGLRELVRKRAEYLTLEAKCMEYRDKMLEFAYASDRLVILQ